MTIRDVANDGYAQVTVSDTGSGIAPEDLPQIFDRFYKSGGSAPGASGSGPGRSAPGTSGSGLGLTIAKNLVAAHGGEITAESTPEEGTSVRFTLPLWPGGD